MTSQHGVKELEGVHKIDPRVHPKYSPNLYKWLNKLSPSFRQRVMVYSHTCHDFLDPLPIHYIGFLDLDDQNWFHGSKLNTVLCNGAKATVFAYSIKYHFPDNFQIIPEFWDNYIKIGRCAIDTNHSIRFLDDKSRWARDRDTRVCQWCGHTQHLKRWEETVEREAWCNLP